MEELYIPFENEEKKKIYLDLLPSCQMIFSKFGYGLINVLYDLGYRKIPEKLDYIDGYKQGFKEGVQALQIQVKAQDCSLPLNDEFIIIPKGKLDEILKELTCE